MNLVLREARARADARDAIELATLVRESVTADAAREVLHLRLDAVAPALRRPHHRRLLRDALFGALASARSRIFDLPNGDLVAVARVPAPALQDAHAALLRTLDAASGAAVRRLRLPEEAAQLLRAAAESLGLEPGEAPPAAPRGRPLGSADLAAAERALAAADPEPVTLTQQVCRLEPDSTGAVPVWEDRRLSWPALAEAVLPGRDLQPAPGLARRLSRLAESRMLAELARPAAQRDWRPIGLPLAPATLDGPAFAHFAESLPAGRRREVVIGLRPADLLGEPAARQAGRRLVAQGFRLALDDASAVLLAMLPPERLAPELVLRLAWEPRLPASLPASVARWLEAGPERVVLVGVDRAAAIAWGWEIGIRLFQGPLIEKRQRGL